MDPQARDVAASWSRVRDIFFAALDVDEAARADFVRGACANDEPLEREVLRLIALDKLTNTFLERPAISELAPLIASTEALLGCGDLLADRYRIVALIGRGGMGEVYEAHDEVIDDVVALKVVRAELEPVEALAARWRREVLLARKVSHSGVCRVHDVAIHRQGDRELLLLTMERVNGESLGARVRRADVRFDEALTIAHQIALAVDAAHAQGVLHRDVKPDNILIEPRDDGGVRAVLTDFGLARDVTGSAALTQAGRVAGTPGYLAPELLRGEAPSARSDLYAFAVVIRTLVSNGMPELTPRVQAVFARALSAEPLIRFDSAGDFVDALAAATQPVSHPWRQLTTGRVPVVVALFGVVALSVAAFRFYQRAEATISPASQVLLTDMVNGTTEREFDGASEVLRSQLAQSTHFELLEPERIRAALTEMGRADAGISTPEVAREIAMREGVPLVVYAALTRLGNDYTVSVKLEQVGTRPSLARSTWTQTFVTATKAGLFDTMHAAAVWIRRMAGEVPAALEDQDRAASETTTSSWEALRLFTQANTLSAAGRLNEATLVLEQAVRVDPDFAMAQTRLGDNLISLRRDKEGHAAWQRAIALAERRELTSRETLRIRGQYFDDTGDLAAAEKAYRTYTIHYPNDFYAAFFLGTLLTQLDRVAEAVPWLEKALNQRPSSLAGAVHLTLAYLDLRRPADVARTIAHVESLNAPDWSTWLRALSMFTSGKLDDALAALEPLRSSIEPQWRSRTFTLRASWLSEVGRDDAALAELRLGIDFDSSLGLRDRLADKWLHLAELQRRRRDKEATTSVHRALETASNARRLASAASILVRAGERADAQRLIARFDDLPQVPATVGARNQALAELAMGAGDFQGAVTAFERAIANARRSESRLPLARALARAGDQARAERLLTVAAEHPVAIYSGPEPQGPGLWRHTITELSAVVERRDAAAAADIRQRFAPMFLNPARSFTR